MSKSLQMSLKTKWFEMTKAGIKTEDYREITEYWVIRLINHKESRLSTEQIERFIKNHEYYGYNEIETLFKHRSLNFKKFTHNTMTLGYPKSTDTERILKLEHKGIEIGYGKEEWGAESNKLYFIIKHGVIIND